MHLKRLTVLVIVMIRCISSYGQKQDISETPVYYQVAGLIYAYNYDITKRMQLRTFKIPKPALKFEVVRRERNDSARYDFLIIKFLPITSDIVANAGVKISLTYNNEFLNSEDNKKYFWITQDELNNLVSEKIVEKRYRLSHEISYGANISLPLKVRPEVLDQNMRFSPDISVGGYLGFRHRISRRNPVYVSFPYVNAGLVTLLVTAETDQSVPAKGDGIIVGVSGSTGIMFQVKDLQLGFLVGRDKAVGELGKSWIYNGKNWYGVSIGFSFVGNHRHADHTQK